MKIYRSRQTGSFRDSASSAPHSRRERSRCTTPRCASWCARLVGKSHLRRALTACSPPQPSVDPSLVPPFLLLSLPLAYLSYRFYARLTTVPPSQRPYDPKTGIGRGAPGFQTGVRKVAIPKDLMERIKRGEEVSADEITRGIERERERLEREERSDASASEEESPRRKMPETVDEDWLPAGSAGASAKNKSRRRKK